MNIKKLIKKLDKSYDLYYVDYRDSLDDKDYDDVIYQSIIANSLDPIQDLTMDWEWNEHESIRTIIDETYTEEEQKYINDNDEVFEAIQQEIYNRNDSDPAKDLMGNTGDRYYFYTFNTEVEGINYGGGEESRTQTKRYNQVRKVLKKYKISMPDKDIYELCDNASYGGSLGLLFRAGSDVFINNGKDFHTFTIHKGDCQVAIIDYCNGSGHSVGIDSAKLPYTRENIGIENYFVHQVCGMVLDSCEISFGRTRKPPRKAKPLVGEYIADSVGNMICDTITMTHIRSWNDQEGWDEIKKKTTKRAKEKGFLWDFDISIWRKDRDIPQSMIELSKKGGWLGKIKQITPTTNYIAGYVLFNQAGTEIVATKCISYYDYFTKYINNMIKK